MADRDLPTDDMLRKEWRKAGGRFHGPNVETGTMPEAKLLPYLRGLHQRAEGFHQQVMNQAAVIAGLREEVRTIRRERDRLRLQINQHAAVCKESAFPLGNLEETDEGIRCPHGQLNCNACGC